MGEILQANVFAEETPSQLHTHCQKPSVVIPHPVAAVLSLLLTAAGAGSLPSLLDLLLPGSEGCLPLCPISTCHPQSFALFQALLHTKL